MKNLLISIVLLFFVNLIDAQNQATLLGTWDDPDLIGSNVHDNTYNEMWGVAINGKEYAIIGSTAGAHFVDVTDPSQPTEAFFVEGRSTGGQIIHRDFHDFNGYLYAVSDEGASSLQIIDLQNLPSSISVVYDKSDLIKKAHNIFIDEEHALLYAFATKDGNNDSYAMRVYCLADPTNPVFLAEHKTFDGLTVGHVHDGYVEDNIAFLNCGGDGFIIADFTDPLNPVTLSKLESYPQQGYNHSGWPTTDLSYYYMADENYSKDIKVVDINDLENISVTGTFNAEKNSQFTITHNQVVACGYLYVSYYFEGLQVYDISTPSAPVRVLEFDTYQPENYQAYKGAWGVYPFLPSGNILVSDMQSGLFVFDAIDENCDGRVVTRDTTIECVETSTATIDNILESKLNVYPSIITTGNNIKVELDQMDSQQRFEEISLINSTGSVLKSWTLNSDISSYFIEVPTQLSHGIYFLNFHNKEHAVTKPIIVQ